MKKLLMLSALALLVSGCEVGHESTESSDPLTYVSEARSFSLQFNKDWEDYTAHQRTLDWGIVGQTDSIDFGLGEDSSIFNISIFEKAQWEELAQEEGPKPTQFEGNEEFIYAYDKAQDVSELNRPRYEEVEAIIETFEFIAE